MKKITIALGLLFLATPAFACRSLVPKSEAIRYNAAAARGESVPGGASCAEKPDEPCLCFDHCEGWDVCEVKEVEEEIELPNGKKQTVKIEKLVNNLEKLQARRAKEDIEKNHREIAQAKRKQARQKLKDLDLAELDSMSTNAQIKSVLKKVLPELVELLKEER